MTKTTVPTAPRPFHVKHPADVRAIADRLLDLAPGEALTITSTVGPVLVARGPDGCWNLDLGACSIHIPTAASTALGIMETIEHRQAAPAPAQVEGIALESENGLWGPNMTRQVYTTEPALLDDRGRRIGWQMFAQEYPGPLGVSVFHVWMQPTRAGKHYGPGGSAYCPPEKLMSPDQATAEMGRLMRQALKRYRKVFAPKS